MQLPRPASLGEALQRADLAGRVLAGERHVAALADLNRLTCLAVDPQSLRGRRVLVAAEDQFLGAITVAELDGIAGRMLLCPPDVKADDLPTLVARAELDTVVSDRAMDIVGLPLTTVSWPPHPRTEPRGPEGETEWLLLTSGTTGVPKIVAYSFAALTGAIHPPTPGPAPVWATFYDMRRYGGLQIFLRGFLGTGSMILSSAGEAVSDHLHRLGRHGVTHLTGTPSHWRRALMSPALTAIDPVYVRLSGEIADQAVLDGLKHAFPRARIGHAYASTEAGVGFEVNDGLEGFSANLLGSATGVDIRVEDGSLRLRSARTAARYVGSFDVSLADDDGFVDTGDMVERRGDRFYFVGRRGGIVNVGGLKVHPEEVEAVLNRHPGVQMARVEGRKNPITGAIVVASVVQRPDSGASTNVLRADLLDLCRQSLPAHKVPAVITFVPALAVTPAGKLVRSNA